MKQIIRQLFGDKAANEAKKLTAWVSELGEMDDIAALKLSTQKLALLMQEEGLSTQQKLDLILEIEELNKPRLEKLAWQFANVANMKSDVENNMGDSCYLYCRQSYICHLKIIELVINPSAFHLDGEKPIQILARAVNCALNMCKWRMLMQQNTPAKVWLQTYTLYKIAHKQGLLNIPIQVFPLSPDTTLSATFVQFCMLGQLTQANVQKPHIEIASRLLIAWLTRARISQKYTPEQYLFYINLSSDFAAKRMRNFEPNDNCRYWELDDFEKKLTVAINMTDRGEMPESLVFSKIDNVKKLNETLSILQAEWRRNEYIRQRRKEVREATSKTAKVNAGIVEICNQVLHANQTSKGVRLSRSGKSLEELIRSHTVLKQANMGLGINSSSLDTWIITDESAHGYGARVNKYANILARPDKLIVMVMDGEPDTAIIGMVRGVKPTRGNQLKAGIEVISRKPVWVQLKLAQETSTFMETVADIHASRSAPIDTGEFSGIYLPVEASLAETASLILPKMNYRPNAKYTILIEGTHKRGMLGEPIDSRDDWVQVQVLF